MSQEVGTAFPKCPHCTLPSLYVCGTVQKESELLLQNQRKVVLQVAVSWPVVLRTLSSLLL